MDIMALSLLKKIFGDRNERILKPLRKKTSEINDLEPKIAALSDDQLKEQTEKFKQRLAKGERLDDMLVEAFATVREASKRALGMRHFDTQMIGGMILHDGCITEMRTGEGKTLVATLPVYLNALTGKGVHVVTVNDYLAKRDAEWMGKLYNFLGLTVGCIVANLDDEERKEAYAADITYATNNELGFDYLRDNMKFRESEIAQRPFNYAIVDEVDSILIDEARTPLIISGPAEDSSELYIKMNTLIPLLKPEHYEKDEKARSITLTEDGIEAIEGILKEHKILDGSLYDVGNVSLVHHVNLALRAHHLFTKDVDYIVQNNQVVIVDEFTGRSMEGRRFSEGLHQALEARENVPVQVENQTLASITFQNYFRLYPKLSGMTGTAMTEASEFMEIYELDVIEVPTNLPMIRQDQDDEIYRTQADKDVTIVKVVEDCYKRKQPILVGTASIEKSEHYSALLKKHKIPHHVLNARHHQNEAFVIAQAGRLGAVTIATNMAGRGTDIQLGGNVEMLVEEAMLKTKDQSKLAEVEKRIIAEVKTAKENVLKAGGLYVIGTERNESRRIDNQLRGRSGRQGDPGKTSFYLSLQDDLMRIFGSERMDSILVKLGLEEGEAITHPWVNKAIERAQKRVEARNFDIRKQLLKFDDVMNDQRKVIYDQRREIMAEDDLSDTIKDMIETTVDDITGQFTPQNVSAEQWSPKSLKEESQRLLALNLPIQDWVETEKLNGNAIHERLWNEALSHYAEKVATYGPEIMRSAEKAILIQVLDQLWKDHLLSLDQLRQGINLRAYGQRDPLNEYKTEAFTMFQDMLGRLNHTVTEIVSHVRIGDNNFDDAFDSDLSHARESRNDPAMEGLDDAELQGPHAIETVRHPSLEDMNPGNPQTWGKVSRNAACPCGSGKKFKQCHGKLTS